MGLSRLLLVFLAASAILAFSPAFAKVGEHSGTVYLKNRIFSPQPGIGFAPQLSISGEKQVSHMIAVFDGIPDDGMRSQLKEQGITLLEYIPDNSWLISYTGTHSNAGNIKGLLYMGPVLPSDKLSSGFNEYMPSIVFFFHDVPAKRMENLLMDFGSVKQALPNAFEAQLDYQQAQKLAGLDEVQWIEPARAVLATQNDGARAAVGDNTLQSAPYNLNGTNITVAVWDAGYANHTDYNSRTTRGDPGEGSNHFHATHVAGTILGSGQASGANGGSALQWRGMAPNATLLTYEWPNSVSEIYDEFNNSVAIYSAVISSNSWGYDVGSTGCDDGLGSYDSLSQAFDYVVQGNSSLIAGPMTVVFSAGNERDNTGCNQSTVLYNTTTGPGGTAKNVITVGAVNSDTLSMTPFSSWGPTDDGRIKPDVVAPGDEVGGDGGIKSAGTSDDYSVLTGTSMSAPVVSGISALLYEKYRYLNFRNPKPATIKALLIQTALDINNTGPDYSTGYGLINGTKAIDLLSLDVNSSEYVVESSLPSTGQNASYRIFAQQGQNITVTLVWDDYPASVSAYKTLVNDLDLVVLDSQGTRHYPWTLNFSAPAAPAQAVAPDRSNVVERVDVTNATQGIWIISVNASSLPVANQSFSLVSSHDMSAVPSVNLSGPANGFVSTGAINFTCTASDIIGLSNATLYANFTGTFAANQTVNISSTQNSSYWNFTSLPQGQYLWTCLVRNINSASSFAQSNKTFYVDLGPSWSQNSSSIPSQYSASSLSVFNISWNSSHAVSSVLIEGNWSGSAMNYSMYYSAVYSYNQTLPAGTFYWRSHANSSNNVINSTQQFVFTVQRAQSALFLRLNSSQSNMSVVQNATVNITAWSPVSGQLLLYVNSTLIQNSTGYLENHSLFATPGIFNVSVFIVQSQNYSANYSALFVTVNDTQPPSVSMFDVFPPLIIASQNITISASVADNVNVSAVLYNISNSTFSLSSVIIPSGGVYNASVATQGIATGDYNVSLLANDTSANRMNQTMILKVRDIRNLSLSILDRNSSLKTASFIRLQYANRSDIANQSANSSVLQSILATGLWDVAVGGSFNFTIFSINISQNVSVNISADSNITVSSLPASVASFVQVVAVQVSSNFSSVQMNISYNESDFVNESRVVIYSCHNWTLSSRQCLSSWVNESMNSTFYMSQNVASIDAYSLSAFAVAESAVCGDGIVDSGESCDSSSLVGQSCVGLGYSSGTLSCTAGCAFDTSSCSSSVSSSSSGGGGGGGGGTSQPKKNESINPAGSNEPKPVAVRCTKDFGCIDSVYVVCENGAYANQSCDFGCSQGGCIKPVCIGSQKYCAGQDLYVCSQGNWTAVSCEFGCIGSSCKSPPEQVLPADLLAVSGSVFLAALALIIAYAFIRFERMHNANRRKIHPLG